jgi:hypothetical protein
VRIETDDVGDRCCEVAVPRLDDDRVDARKGVVGALDHEIGDPAGVAALAVVVDERRPADEFGNEPIVERDRVVAPRCRHVASPGHEKSRRVAPPAGR